MMMGLGIALVALGGIVIGYGSWENQRIAVSHYEIKTKKIEQTTCRIVHLSDLHIREFSVKEELVIAKSKELKPDLIVITGDLVDKSHYNEKDCLRMIRGIEKIAPCYFISGNHEIQSGFWEDLKKRLERTTVTVLENQSDKKNNIELIGYDDASTAGLMGEEVDNKLEWQINQLEQNSDPEAFRILLAHKPEWGESYGRYKWDLILSGHTHGGQIALPGYGAFYTPHQRFFPTYDRGLMEVGESKLIISRGIGTSLLPLRIGSIPEIVVIDLVQGQ